jgi:protein TonB
MNRDRLVAITIAVVGHAVILFGFRWKTVVGTPRVAAPAFQVTLVEATPHPAVEAPALEAPPPPPPPDVPLPVPPAPPPLLTTVAASAPPAPPITPETPPPLEFMAPHQRPKSAKSDSTTSHVPQNSTGPHAGKPVATAATGPASPVRVRTSPRPPYPPEARRLGQQGRVLLSVQINADGRVTSASVRQSSGIPALDSAAVQGVLRWTFEPARVAGVAVASRAEVPVNFSLAQ